MIDTKRHRADSGRGESGASLVLALAFLLIVSAAVATLTTWVSNDLRNTHQFSNVRLVHLVEADALNLDMSQVRPTPTACASTPFVYTADNPPVDVWCDPGVPAPTKSASRTVTFWSCLASDSQASCKSNNSPISIKAVVIFDDYTSGVHVPSKIPCAPPQVCGTGMNVAEWIVR
jgi:hypothetical protein